MMIPEGQYKRKYGRLYRGWNPAKFDGPTTAILDTVLKPVPPKEDTP